MSEDSSVNETPSQPETFSKAAALSHQSIPDFTKALASRSPVPGGGGAAALTGALSAALASMVCEYTRGKKKYAAYEADIARIMENAGQIRERLLALIDEDASCFEPLSQAYSLPKDDPKHDEVLDEAMNKACMAPLEMMRQAASVAVLCEELLEKGSRLMISDTGCCASLSKACLECAYMNVLVNTRSMKDRDTAFILQSAADTIFHTYLPRARAVCEKVLSYLKEEKQHG